MKNISTTLVVALTVFLQANAWAGLKGDNWLDIAFDDWLTLDSGRVRGSLGTVRSDGSDVSHIGCSIKADVTTLITCTARSEYQFVTCVAFEGSENFERMKAAVSGLKSDSYLDFTFSAGECQSIRVENYSQHRPKGW